MAIGRKSATQIETFYVKRPRIGNVAMKVDELLDQKREFSGGVKEEKVGWTQTIRGLETMPRTFKVHPVKNICRRRVPWIKNCILRKLIWPQFIGQTKEEDIYLIN